MKGSRTLENAWKMHGEWTKGCCNALVFQKLCLSLHPRLINECLTYLLIKNESIRNRFHFNSRFV